MHSRAVCKSGAKGISLFWAPSLTSFWSSHVVSVKPFNTQFLLSVFFGKLPRDANYEAWKQHEAEEAHRSRRRASVDRRAVLAAKEAERFQGPPRASINQRG